MYGSLLTGPRRLFSYSEDYYEEIASRSLRTRKSLRCEARFGAHSTPFCRAVSVLEIWLRTCGFLHRCLTSEAPIFRIPSVETAPEERRRSSAKSAQQDSTGDGTRPRFPRRRSSGRRAGTAHNGLRNRVACPSVQPVPSTETTFRLAAAPARRRAPRCSGRRRRASARRRRRSPR